MIVDDEPFIRERLTHAVAWEELNFSVCGTAANGYEALQLVPKLRPDVILADIVMPVMDGLELLRQLKNNEELPTPKIVFLSGHDNFDFLRSAMRLGAEDYLLKPLEQNAVQALFQRIEAELDEDKKMQLQLQHTRQILDMTRNELPGQLILSYLQGTCTDKEMLLFVLDHYLGAGNATSYSLAFLRIPIPMETSELQAQLDTQKISDPCPLVIPFQSVFLILFFFDHLQAKEELTRFFSTANLSGYQCTLSDTLSFETLPTAFSKYFHHTHNGFYQPINQIVPQSCTVIKEPSLFDLMPTPQFLFDGIRLGDRAKFQQQLRFLLHKISAHQINPDSLIVRLTDLFIQTTALCRQVHGSMESVSFDAIHQKLQVHYNYHDLSAEYEALLLQLFDQFQRAIQLKGDLIIQIKEYIALHYNEELSLESLSQQFYLNPSYLSSQFSKKTGMTISAYLRDIRLKKAAQFLTETTMHISDISSAVGYQNYRHFCKLFKEQYSISPKAYRNNHLMNTHT